MASSANTHKGTFQGPPAHHNKKSWAQTVSGGAKKTSSISRTPNLLPNGESGTLTTSADPTTPPLDHFSSALIRPFIKGTVDHSLLIDITNVIDEKKKTFLSAFKEFCGGQAHLWSVRDHFRRDYNRCYAEVVVSPSKYHYFLNNSTFSLSFFTDTFRIYPSLSPTAEIMKISLTGLPDQYGRLFGGTEQLTRDMNTNMSRFGTLLDCGFVTGASGVYSGNGYAVISTDNTSPTSPFKSVSHKFIGLTLPLIIPKRLVIIAIFPLQLMCLPLGLKCHHTAVTAMPLIIL